LQQLRLDPDVRCLAKAYCRTRGIAATGVDWRHDFRGAAINAYRGPKIEFNIKREGDSAMARTVSREIAAAASFLALRYKSLRPPFVLHATNNGLVALLVLADAS